MSFKKIDTLLFLCLIVYGCSLESESELCFIGDSITHQWDLDSYFPGYVTIKHAVDGAKLHDINTWDVSDCSGKPTFLLIGTNDIGFLPPNYNKINDTINSFSLEYAKIANSIGASPLYVISILPRNYLGEQDTAINQIIEKQNKSITTALDSLLGDYKYINLFYNFFKKGYRIKETLFRDGLHPSTEGYEIMTKKIQEHL